MGVIQLWPILAPVKEHRPLTSLSGQTLAVDLSIWVCESNAIKQMQGVVIKPHLRNLFFRVSNLTQMGIKLVFAVDGEAPELKHDTMAKRQQQRLSGKQKGSASSTKSGKKGRSRFNTILKECCELLDYLGIPYIHSRGEAEALCALLNRHGFADGCLTDDGDAFLYGAKVVYRNFTLNTKDPHVESYCSEDLETRLGLTQEGLVALALLLGCDYLPKGVPGVGKEQAVKLLDQLQGKSMLDRFKFWPTCNLSELEGIEKNVCKKAMNVQQFPNEEVIKEFLIPKDAHPEKDLRIKRPWMEKVQEFLQKKLDWPTDYTEEKVLPLLTLWDMNDIIRTGRHHPSIHLLPHHIVKRRVRQGVPCYEVEWERQDSCCTEEDKPNYRTMEEQELFSRCFPATVKSFSAAEMTKKSSKPGKKKAKDDPKLENGVDGVTDKLENGVDGVTDKLENGVDGVTDKLENGADGVTDKLEGMALETEDAARKNFSQANQKTGAMSSLDQPGCVETLQEGVTDQSAVDSKEKSSVRRKAHGKSVCAYVQKRKTKQKSMPEDLIFTQCDSVKGIFDGATASGLAFSTELGSVDGEDSCLLPETISDESEEEIVYIPLSQRIGLGLLTSRAAGGGKVEMISLSASSKDIDSNIKAQIPRGCVKTEKLSKKSTRGQINLNSDIEIKEGYSMRATEFEQNGNHCTEKGKNSNKNALKGNNFNEISLKRANSHESCKDKNLVGSSTEQSNSLHSGSTDVSKQRTRDELPGEKKMDINSNHRTKSDYREIYTMESDVLMENKDEEKLNCSLVVHDVFDNSEEKTSTNHFADFTEQLADVMENLSLNNDSVDLFSTPAHTSKTQVLSPPEHHHSFTPEVVTRCVKQSQLNKDAKSSNQNLDILSNILKYSPTEVLDQMTESRGPKSSAHTGTPAGILSRMEKYSPQIEKQHGTGMSWTDLSSMSPGSPVAYGLFNIESSLLNITKELCTPSDRSSTVAGKSKANHPKSDYRKQASDFTPFNSRLLHSTSTPHVVKVQTDVPPIYFGSEAIPSSSPPSDKGHDTNSHEIKITRDNLICSGQVEMDSRNHTSFQSPNDNLQKCLDYKLPVMSVQAVRQFKDKDFRNCVETSDNQSKVEEMSDKLTKSHQQHHRGEAFSCSVKRQKERNKTKLVKTGIAKLDKENNTVDVKQSVGDQNCKAIVTPCTFKLEQTSSPMALADRLQAKIRSAKPKTISHDTVLSVKKLGDLSNRRRSGDLCTNVKPVRKT